jgi:hypothetical protein
MASFQWPLWPLLTAEAPLALRAHRQAPHTHNAHTGTVSLCCHLHPFCVWRWLAAFVQYSQEERARQDGTENTTENRTVLCVRCVRCVRCGGQSSAGRAMPARTSLGEESKTHPSSSVQEGSHLSDMQLGFVYSRAVGTWALRHSTSSRLTRLGPPIPFLDVLSHPWSVHPACHGRRRLGLLHEARTVLSCPVLSCPVLSQSVLNQVVNPPLLLYHRLPCLISSPPALTCKSGNDDGRRPSPPAPPLPASRASRPPLRRHGNRLRRDCTGLHRTGLDVGTSIVLPSHQQSRTHSLVGFSLWGSILAASPSSNSYLCKSSPPNDRPFSSLILAESLPSPVCSPIHHACLGEILSRTVQLPRTARRLVPASKHSSLDRHRTTTARTHAGARLEDRGAHLVADHPPPTTPGGRPDVVPSPTVTVTATSSDHQQVPSTPPTSIDPLEREIDGGV